MKKSTVFLPFAIFLIVSLGGSLAAQPIVQTKQRTRSAFETLVKAEIAHDKRGAFLYARSEVYRHIIENKVRAKLAAATPNDSILPRPTTDERHGGYTPESLPTADIDLSNDPRDQNETSVAISRNDPTLIIAAANDEGMYGLGMPVYITHNAGQNWKLIRLPRLPFANYFSGGDPILSADEAGGFYYAFLIYDTQGYYSNIAVAHSGDGMRWSYCTPVLPQVITGAFEDKESIAIDRDPKSPHFGRIYVSWVHFVRTAIADDTIDCMRLSWSDDHGKSWTPPTNYEDFPCEYPQPIVGKNGILLLGYGQPDTLGNSGGVHVVQTSTDGGVTLTKHLVASFASFPQPGNSAYTLLKGESGFRAFPYLSLATDPKSGRIYALFGSDDKNASNDIAGLYWSYSDDQGNSWSHPIEVRENVELAAQDRFAPWLTLDESTGEVFASFYTSEEDPGNLFSRYVRVRLSTNGPNDVVRLDSNLFDPSIVGTESGAAPFIGDYSGCDASGKTFAAVWTEHSKDGLDGEIYAYVSSAASGVERQLLNASELKWDLLSQNPLLSGKTRASFSLPDRGMTRVEIVDVRGVVLKEVLNSELGAGQHFMDLDLSTFPNGTYFCKLSFGAQVAITRLVKE